MIPRSFIRGQNILNVKIGVSKTVHFRAPTKDKEKLKKYNNHQLFEFPPQRKKYWTEVSSVSLKVRKTLLKEFSQILDCYILDKNTVGRKR